MVKGCDRDDATAGRCPKHVGLPDGVNSLEYGIHPGCSYLADEFCNKCGWIRTSFATTSPQPVAWVVGDPKDVLIKRLTAELMDRHAHRHDRTQCPTCSLIDEGLNT